mmetsp:Transcript_43938/g.72983  ORF Transcript_43938/g.72983 Transcript_43938/m.72983 type:complete len:419 (-) Transcript_43938:811-2067(-)|eukprot:CAMPEP_0119322772 /NCGR_PEP_ID=MMETSP1333-20130426/59124_1 /TAXON_ID=418940 /ORGANISM="Scyphosphaera apsteinii, Strain RCC1455" /LENGTH=418 /DNA_ID=CAMNT_0007330085 /DNA_START=58 /DNA_END=1314 /DNA_ORIENTATION=+
MARAAHDNVLEVLSYVISFGAFYLFIWVCKRLMLSPTFRKEASCLSKLVYSCVSARLDQAEVKTNEEEVSALQPFWKTSLHLSTCALGIQVSYLLWGLMQERIMTKPYSTGELFSSSKFLVFANRFLALLVAFVALKVQERRDPNTHHPAPLYMFSFSSVSNIMSSVCQYEALKYVSFPTQVLAKSCKMVPVMIMGYIVSRKKYSLFEYVVAVMITAGAAIFKLNEANDAPVKNTEFVGIAFIFGYMGADSFTSNWQEKVFKLYGVGSVEMMMYANLFSSGFTALGLLVTLEIVQVTAYIASNPEIMTHMFVMSVCSAVGQLFIFTTIKKYGPLVFATIQTVRQLLSIVLSIVFFGHPVNHMEALGVAIVFVALGGQIAQKYLASRSKAQKVKQVLESRGAHDEELQPLESKSSQDHA